MYVYTNLFEQSSVGKAVGLQYVEDEKNLAHSFNIQWEKPVSEAVTKASLLVLMRYSSGDVIDALGMVLAEGRGVNMADLNVVGQTQIR